MDKVKKRLGPPELRVKIRRYWGKALAEALKTPPMTRARKKRKK